ncbi:hypothetical protein WN55_02768 [Dufourea novaeangliae]|uniref:Uncharacterized protein n=1 Tax=Dufourea novaeangliae TaxID=178035 RepID=A0A154NXL2_DUFNO|nr:hypothetical protein WN55_02768 [Dufourea novaeangliae]
MNKRLRNRRRQTIFSFFGRELVKRGHENLFYPPRRMVPRNRGERGRLFGTPRKTVDGFLLRLRHGGGGALQPIGPRKAAPARCAWRAAPHNLAYQ